MDQFYEQHNAGEKLNKKCMQPSSGQEVSAEGRVCSWPQEEPALFLRSDDAKTAIKMQEKQSSRTSRKKKTGGAHQTSNYPGGKSCFGVGNFFFVQNLSMDG